MIKMKRNTGWGNYSHALLLAGGDRVRAIMLSGLFFIMALLLSPSVQAATLDCLVKPEMYVELSSPVDSVLETILVDTGDYVTRDQTVATLESSIEKARVKLARLHAKSVSDINNRKVQLQYAKRYDQRMADLFSKNSVSQYERDKAQTEVLLAEIELKKANEENRIAQLNLELALSRLALKTIKSPIDGIVVDRFAMVGESVSERVILKLAKVNPLKVELIAPTEYFGLITRGMEVEIYPEQPANQVFKATVTVVDRLIDPASGSFTVRMELPNPDDQLVGGVNCLARFSFETPEPSDQGIYGSLVSPDSNQ